MSDETFNQQQLDNANEEMAKVLTDAGITLNPFELIMARIDMILEILIQQGLVTETDLDVRWAATLNNLLHAMLEAVKSQAETIEQETNG